MTLGNIERTSSKKYRVRYYDGSKDKFGKARLRRSDVVGTKLEAERLRHTISQDLKRLKDVSKAVGAGRVLSMLAILQRWGENRVSTGNAAPGSIYDANKSLPKIFEKMGWSNPLLITSDAVDRWLVALKQNGQSDKPLQDLKKVLRWAAGPPLRQPIDRGILDVYRKRRPYVPPPQLLTEKQLDECLQVAKEKGGIHVALAFRHLSIYGCRPVDLSKIRVRDFDPVNLEITYTKTKNGRRVTHELTEEDVETYAKLVKGRNPEEYLFTNPFGDPWRLGVRGQGAGLTDWWRGHVTEFLNYPVKQCGIYCLKDYAITTLHSRGVDDATIIAYTGHSSSDVLRRYKTTNAGRRKDALVHMRRKPLQGLESINEFLPSQS